MARKCHLCFCFWGTYPPVKSRCWQGIYFCAQVVTSRGNSFAVWGMLTCIAIPQPEDVCAIGMGDQLKCALCLFSVHKPFRPIYSSLQSSIDWQVPGCWTALLALFGTEALIVRICVHRNLWFFGFLWHLLCNLAFLGTRICSNQASVPILRCLL